MVANVGEILEPEEDEDEAQDGAGFAVKKSGNAENKNEKK